METKILKTHLIEENKSEKIFFRKFLVYWVGQLFSLVGSSIVMFVLIWELTDIAGNNNTILSVAFFLGFLPTVIFMPIAGVISDKFDKRKIIILSDSLQAFFTFLLIPVMWFTNLQIWHILVVNFLRGTCQAFHSPTSFSLTSLLVPKNKLSRMNGLNYLAGGLVNSIGPVIGAFLMVYFVTSTILWLDGLTFMIALLGVLQLKLPSKLPLEASTDSTEQNKNQSFGASFKEGIHTIRAIPGLIGIMMMATFTNFLFQPIDTLLPNFIKYVHEGTKEDLAFFIALFQAGILLGAIFATIIKKWKRPLLWLSLGLYSSSLGFILLGLVPAGNLSWLNTIPLPMMLLNPVVNALFLTLVQLIIPQEKMGRVIAVLMLMSSVASPLGMLIAGPLADALGSIQLLYMICGILSILVVSMTMYRKPVLELMNIAKIELNK